MIRTLFSVLLAVIFISGCGQPQSQINQQRYEKLSYAVMRGNIEDARTILGKIEVPNETINGLLPKCIVHTMKNREQMFKMLVDSGGDLNSTENAHSPVYKGIRFRSMRPELFEWCIENGYNINRTEGDRTLLSHFLDLYYAAPEYYDKIVRILVKNGADVHLKSSGRPAIQRLLLVKNDQRRKELIKLFIQAGVDLEQKNDRGRTALLTAIEFCNENMALQLLELGANHTAADEYGKTALHKAKHHKLARCAEAIISKDSDRLSVSSGKVNYPFAGSWQGSGSDSSGNEYVFAAKVIDLGDGKFRMLVLDKLETEKKPMHVMDGILKNNKFPHTADSGLYTGGGELTEETFTGYYEGPVDGTYKMHRVR